jgi:trigger factor
LKVSTSEVPPRQVALDIEVEQERLDRAMEHAYRRIANRVQVPGFRKGKAPRTMVERVVGRQAIVEDALEHLLPDVVSEAIKQEKVEAYSRPQVESVELDPLRVRALVPLSPNVELGDYATALRIPREEVVVTAEQVESVINRLRESHAQWAPVDRSVQLNDLVGLDVRAEVAESRRVLHHSKDAEYLVDPQGLEPAPGFASQLLGLNAGDEKTFTLALAENYRESALAGSPVEFTVKIHWVKEKQLPELDDVFAQQVGDYADVASLRTTVETYLREREDERVRKAVEEAALDKLVELSTVDVPPQLIEHQADHLLEVFSRNLEQRGEGVSVEQVLRVTGKDRTALREEARAEAEKRVKRALALDAFAKAEQIGVEQEEVEAEVKKATAQVEEPEATETLALGNPQTRARVEAALRERKALERLVELATDAGASASRPAGKSRESPAAARSASDTGTRRKKSAVSSAAGDAEEKP